MSNPDQIRPEGNDKPDRPHEPKPKPKVTCYSDGEGEFMAQSQALRARLLRPLLVLLSRIRMSPNHLTLLSLATGLAFCPAFLWGHYGTAYGLLLAHVILDGLDGPLARHTGKAGNRGSFTDTTSDQVVVAFTTVTLIQGGQAGIWPGSLYIFFYCIVVIFAMIRNALAVPYSWLVRPRFFVYAWIPIEVHLWSGSMNILLWIMTTLLGLKMLTGFFRIREKI